jgi:hypothetical protein
MSSCTIVPNCPGMRRPSHATQPGMCVASDDAGPEDREALEADRHVRLFFQPDHPGVANPALRRAPDCGEKREPFDAAVLASSGEPAADSDFEGLEFLFGPRVAAFPDAHTGGSMDGSPCAAMLCTGSVTAA